jgi:hypothetical protein
MTKVVMLMFARAKFEKRHYVGLRFGHGVQFAGHVAQQRALKQR